MKKITLFWLICNFVIELACCLNINCTAAEDVFQKYTGVISDNAVNVRSGPGLNFETIAKMNKGDLVLVEALEQDWIKIALPRDSNAFVHAEFIGPLNAKFAYITKNHVNVRAGKGTEFNTLGQLNRQDKVELILRDGDWFKVFTNKNCCAWVHKDFIEKHGPTSVYEKNEEYSQKALTLLSEAEDYEKTQSSKNASNINYQQIIDKYQSIIQEFSRSPAANIAKGHVLRLNDITSSLKPKEIEEYQKNADRGVPLACGKVMENGNFLNRVGTHKLITKNKKLYYLTSKTIDLNNYTYYTVSVWGKIQDSRKSKTPLIEVEFVEKVN